MLHCRRGEIFGTNDQSFHPNAEGQRKGYAEAVNNWLNPPATGVLVAG